MQHLNLIITHRCNMCCKHCYQNFPNKEDSQFDNICKILESAKRLGIRSITVTGGECTLHSDFDRILLKIKEMGFELGVFTNGYLLKSDTIDLIDRLYVSLDGPKDYHDFIRGCDGSYGRVLEILDYCLKINHTVSVQITVTSLNSIGIGELISIMKKYHSILETVFIAAASKEGKALENGITLDDLSCIRTLKEKAQEQLGFDVFVKDNVYSGKYLKFLVDSETQFDLWIDGVDMLCYVSNHVGECGVPDFNEEWYLSVCQGISRSLRNCSNFDMAVIDDLILQAKGHDCL